MEGETGGVESHRDEGGRGVGGGGRMEGGVGGGGRG